MYAGDMAPDGYRFHDLSLDLNSRDSIKRRDIGLKNDINQQYSRF